MKILFIGCVKSSETLLMEVLQVKGIKVVGIISRQTSKFNSDFVSLEGLALRFNIPIFFADKNTNDNLVDWAKDLGPDLIYCFGWSHLLSKELLDVPSKGSIGFHPSPLPNGRGRHPIVWALALGLTETASTFFFIDDGADTGDVISQSKISISINDDAETLYKKILDHAVVQVKELTLELLCGNESRIRQIDSLATTWRKRTKSDGKLDWRMSSKSIHNLTRALTRPYPGAYFCLNDVEYSVWKVEIVKEEVSPFLEPGKVISIVQGRPRIKTSDGAVDLIEVEPRLNVKRGDFL